MEPASYDFLFKVVIIGNSGVGKSNLISRYMRNEFNLDSQNTIGVEFFHKILEVDGHRVKFQVWDTAGQERYRMITRSYYRHAHGIVLVYDICNLSSFDNLDFWLQEARQHTNDDPTIQYSLVGNKTDLSYQRTVPREVAATYARERDLYFYEASALEADNVNVVFEDLLQAIYRQLRSKGVLDKTVTVLGAHKFLQDGKNKDNSKKESSCCFQ